MCCVPAPRRCNERVTAPNRNSAADASSRRESMLHDEESESLAPFVVYALEIARAVSLDECGEEPRGRRRAAG